MKILRRSLTRTIKGRNHGKRNRGHGSFFPDEQTCSRSLKKKMDKRTATMKYNTVEKSDENTLEVNHSFLHM